MRHEERASFVLVEDDELNPYGTIPYIFELSSAGLRISSQCSERPERLTRRYSPNGRQSRCKADTTLDERPDKLWTSFSKHCLQAVFPL